MKPPSGDLSRRARSATEFVHGPPPPPPAEKVFELAEKDLDFLEMVVGQIKGARNTERSLGNGLAQHKLSRSIKKLNDLIARVRV